MRPISSSVGNTGRIPYKYGIIIEWSLKNGEKNKLRRAPKETRECAPSQTQALGQKDRTRLRAESNGKWLSSCSSDKSIGSIQAGSQAAFAVAASDLH